MTAALDRHRAGSWAASSSCSYAAVAITRSIFRKGANFTAAMAFEMASTNLVLKLSIIKRRHQLRRVLLLSSPT